MINLLIMIGIILDTYVLSFFLKPFGITKSLYYVHLVFSIFLFVDIPLNFFTAIRKDENSESDQLSLMLEKYRAKQVAHDKKVK